MAPEWIVAVTAVTAVIGLITALINWRSSGRKEQQQEIKVIQIQQNNGERPHRPDTER
jgi:hypothetical protein